MSSIPALKIVHVCSTRYGGAGVAAWRIHTHMREVGLSSWFISRDTLIAPEDSEHHICLKEENRRRSWAENIFSYLWPRSERNLRVRWNKVRNDLNYEAASLPFSRIPLHNHPLVKRADIVHLHWTNGLLHFPTFFRNTKRVLVITAHDQYYGRGLFHFSDDQSRNRPVVARLDDIARHLKLQAYKAYGKTITLIGPSQWMRKSMEKLLPAETFQFKCIPYGMPQNFKVNLTRQQARQQLNIPGEGKMVVFGANHIHLYRKGFDMLLGAIPEVQKEAGNTVWVAMGKSASDDDTNRDIIFTGFLHDPLAIATYFTAADLVVLPSREDNLPNIMLEALICGTPVVSFANGGMPEHITDGQNGFIVHEQTAQALANGILAALKTNWDSVSISQGASAQFSQQKITDAHIELYNSLVNGG